MAWWERIPRATQAWLTIGAVFVGFTGTTFAVGAATSRTIELTSELPIRLDVAEERLMIHDTAILTLQDATLNVSAKLDRLECLLLLPDSTRPLLASRICR